MNWIRRLVISLLANTAALYLIDHLLRNFCFVESAATTCPESVEASWAFYLVGGAILGLLNFLVKPLLKIVSLPITFLTAGLFMFVINAAILWLLGWLVNTAGIDDYQILVDGSNIFVVWLEAAVILSLFNLLTHWLTKK